MANTDHNLQPMILSQAHYLPSPHCDERPPHLPVSLLVIHCISLPPAQFGAHYIEQFFMSQLNHDEHPYFKTIEGLRVSSHLLIKRTGALIQFVPLDKRAWHAGESTFKGRGACNDFSIGIELEGTEDTPYTKEQYDTLVDCTKFIQRAFPLITTENIVGHSDIAPGRKTDPGPSFDWQAYRASLS